MRCPDLLTSVGPVQAEASTDEYGRSAPIVQPDDTSFTAAGAIPRPIAPRLSGSSTVVVSTKPL
jgi:hypothetical protein